MSESRFETIKLTPSQTRIAINHMIGVNLENAKLGKKRRGLFVWGPPGIAKSSIIEQICRERNFKLIDIRLTQMDPTDLRGIPVPVKTDDGEVAVRWAIPEMLPQGNEKAETAEERNLCKLKRRDGGDYDGAVILLDELPNAAPSVQAGAYQLVLDGQLGEWICPDNVVVIAAGNRDTDRGATFKMPVPLQNRFIHIEMESNFKDFQAYALSAGFDSTVVGFLTAFKDELFKFDAGSAARGFPTPRTWEFVSDIIRDDPNIPEQVLLALIAGAVGDGTAVKFNSYRKNAADLPEPEAILDGKVTELKSRNGERVSVQLMFALTTSMCYELKDRAKEASGRNATAKAKERLNKSCHYFLRFMMDNFQEELVVMGARTALALFEIPFDSDNIECWDEFSERYEDMVCQA